MAEGLRGPAGAAWKVGTSPTKLSMDREEVVGKEPSRGLCAAFRGVKKGVGEDGRRSCSNVPVTEIKAGQSRLARSWNVKSYQHHGQVVTQANISS